NPPANAVVVQRLDFSSRNRRAGPQHVPHPKLSAHRQPPIAPTLRPPRPHVVRCGGPGRLLPLSFEILSCDFAFPSSRISRSISVTLNRARSPGPLPFHGLPFFPREGIQRGSRH